MIEYKYVINEYLNLKKSKSAVITYIKNAILKRDGCILASITGQVGSGKSYAAMRLCEEIDPYFNSDRIVFSVKDFAKLMAKPYPKGSAFLFEEAQHGAHNLNFWSKGNKGLFYLLSTLRHRNYFTIFTMPQSSSVDSQSRKLFQVDIRATGKINKKEGKSLCKVFFPSASEYKKDVVYLNPLKLHGKGGSKKINRVWVNLPSKKLLDAYHKKKYAFTSKLSTTIAISLEDELITKIVKKQTKK